MLSLYAEPVQDLPKPMSAVQTHIFLLHAVASQQKLRMQAVISMHFLPLSVYKSSSAEAWAGVAVKYSGLASQRRYHRHCMDNAVPEG